MRRLLALAALVLLAGPAAAAVLHDPSPAEGTRVAEVVSIRVGIDGDVDPATALLVVDGRDVSGHEEFSANASAIAYDIPSFLPLAAGPHTVRAKVTDLEGATAVLEWTFDVGAVEVAPQEGPGRLLSLVLVAALAIFLGGSSTGAWWWSRRRMTLEKLLVRYPVRREHLVVALPAAVAVLGVLAGAWYLSHRPSVPRFAYENLLLVAAAVAFGPSGIDAHLRRRRVRANERAFAQFLFEVADALRGGIDPLKALAEIARTETGVLRKPLRRAADAVRLGRPFEVALRNLAKDLGSPLAERYALLVGEAASSGGAVAAVVYRAAKDMDEMVRLEEERARELKMPVITIYVAVVILLLMVRSLVQFAPLLQEMDLGGFGPKEAAGKVARMDPATLGARFLHLVALNAAGAGLLAGMFSTGKLRYGLLHALVLAAACMAFYELAVV